MEIVSLQPGHLLASSKLLARAFENDGIIRYFFETAESGVLSSAETFFGLLSRARIRLESPALAAKEGGEVLGATLGYGTVLPEWPEDLKAEWTLFESSIPGLESRFEAYHALSDQFQPSEPHFYLGVLGVDPASQGRGIGGRLLDAFSQLSAHDSNSTGVYLETANANSRRLYERKGYELVGSGFLGETSMWCMFQPKER